MSLFGSILKVGGGLLGTALGGPIGGAIGSSLGGALGGGGGGGGGGAGTAAGGLLAATLTKEQLQKSIEDYNKAQEGSLAAFTGARDASMGAYTGARDASLGYFDPYQKVGANALNRNNQMQSGGFQYSPSDPSYGFRFGEGMNALLRQQAASGALQSGGGEKAAIRYGQGMGSTEFANDFARNNQLAGMGLSAADGAAQVQNNYANGVANTQNHYADGTYNALFAGARGRDPARQNKAGAITDQVSAGTSLLGSLFGGGSNPLAGGVNGLGGGFDFGGLTGSGPDFTNVPSDAFSGGFDFGGGGFGGGGSGGDLSSFFGF